MGAHADPVGAIQAALQVGRRHYPWFLLLWVPAFLLELAVGFSDPYFREARGLPLGELTTGETLELLGVQVPLLILAYTVRLALWTFVALGTLDAILGGNRKLRWRALVLPALSLGFVLVLVYTVGAFLVLIGFFIFLHWFVYAPAMLAEGTKGVGAALEASRAFARERRTFGFTALIVLLGALSFGVSYLLEAQPGAVGIVAPALFAWLVGPVVPMLAASFVAVAHQAPLPSQVRTSTPARETTSCPRCATIIHHPSRGSPVDVICPACGHTGRVL